MDGTFAVVIPNFNGEATILQCLQAIFSSSLLPDEVIVSDDASTDSSLVLLSKFYPQIKIIRSTQGNTGSSGARNRGQASSEKEFVVFVDVDVQVSKNSFQLILEAFQKNPAHHWIVGSFLATQFTGQLPTHLKTHPVLNSAKDFYSDYKNIYMSYVFSALPENIDFIFGSICAVRGRARYTWPQNQNVTEDTEHGIQATNKWKQKIYFHQDLKVNHLKKYTFTSLLKNDFWVPHSWALLFWQHSSPKEALIKRRFAHARLWQIFGLAVAALVLLAPLLLNLASPILSLSLMMVIAASWFGWNLKFLLHLRKHFSGLTFVKATAFTLLDQWTMAFGVIVGSLEYLFGKRISPAQFTNSAGELVDESALVSIQTL